MQIERNKNDTGLSAALIAVRGLCKVFSNGGASVNVLENLDFDLAAGETVAIVGASGIGKSTLLHILGTLDRPDRGKLLFMGEDVFSYDDLKLARFRNESIGFVFQFHHLLPEFSSVDDQGYQQTGGFGGGGKYPDQGGAEGSTALPGREAVGR